MRPPRLSTAILIHDFLVPVQVDVKMEESSESESQSEDGMDLDSEEEECSDRGQSNLLGSEERC